MKMQIRLDLKKLAIFGILAIIFLLALQVRLPQGGEKWLSAYDPYMQYRYTSYVVEYGILPKWDPYSYYPPGRPLNAPPLMYYLTGYAHLLLVKLLKLLNVGLMLFTKYAAAFYGAFAVIPAFLLGREISDRWAGLLAAFFVGLSPAILQRTMAGFYDTDPLVIFFTLLTGWALIRLLRKKSRRWKEWKNFKDFEPFLTAVLAMTLFALTWKPAWYLPIIFILATPLYFLILAIFGKGKKGISKIMIAFNRFIGPFCLLLGALLASAIVVKALGYSPFQAISTFTGFAIRPQQVQIVNISVAELQPLNVFGGAWKQLFARVSVPLIFVLAGALLLFRKSKRNFSILIVWTAITLFSILRGIRFMLIFAPAASIGAAVCLAEAKRASRKLGQYAPLFGFGFLGAILASLFKPLFGLALATFLALIMLFLKRKEKVPKLSKAIWVGTALFAVVLVLSQGTKVAATRGTGGLNKNWKKAYFFLRNQTAQDAVVGTWWDPGHRIATIAKRRNIADGAHCSEQECDPGLNTRISDLGLIFRTTNEEVAARTLLKYRKGASEIYWIASNDLIGKFRWLQYFSIGCDGTGVLTPRGQIKCPLYSQLPLANVGQNVLFYRGNVGLIKQRNLWLPVLGLSIRKYRSLIKGNINPQDLIFVRNLIFEDRGKIKRVDFKKLGFNNTRPATLWLSPGKGYCVFIPQTPSIDFRKKYGSLEDSIFSRMFFMDGKGLKYFELVLKNPQVKIYKLKIKKAMNEINNIPPSYPLEKHPKASNCKLCKNF